MASEKTMWETIRPELIAAGLDPVRVENGAVGIGTPDVNITTGWIENKFARRWPPREGPLRLDHYTPKQRAWALRREKAGGKVWLLLRVDKEWLLFSGGSAALLLGTDEGTREALYRAVIARWTRKPKSEEIAQWLT